MIENGERRKHRMRLCFKTVTPFGGLAGQTATFTAFLMSVLVGVRRFAQQNHRVQVLSHDGLRRIRPKPRHSGWQEDGKRQLNRRWFDAPGGSQAAGRRNGGAGADTRAREGLQSCLPSLTGQNRSAAAVMLEAACSASRGKLLDRDRHFVGGDNAPVSSRDLDAQGNIWSTRHLGCDGDVDLVQSDLPGREAGEIGRRLRCRQGTPELAFFSGIRWSNGAGEPTGTSSTTSPSPFA